MRFRDQFHAGRPDAPAGDPHIETASATVQDAATNAEAAKQRYRVISIDAVRAPEGCTGADWLSYRIAQGINEITGYRRGSLESVSADVDTIVAALNSRREWRKPESKVYRRGARARRANAEAT